MIFSLDYLFQNEEPHTSQKTYKLVTALEKQLARRLEAQKQELNKRNTWITQAYDRLKYLEGTLQATTSQLQECHRLRQTAETSLQDKTRQMAEMQRTIDELNAKVRTYQTKLGYAQSQINSLNDRVARHERRLNGQPEPELTSEICMQFLMRDAQQAAEIYGADSALAQAKQKRLDQLPQTDSPQGSRREMSTAGSNQMPTTPNEALAAAQEKIRHVEEALRTKTLQWQELHPKFEQLQQQLQVAQETNKNYRTQVLSLKGEVEFEKNHSSFLRKTKEQLERKFGENPDRMNTPELRRERLIRDLKEVADTYGEECKMYKNMQTELNRMLNAQAQDAGVQEAEQARLAEIKAKGAS